MDLRTQMTEQQRIMAWAVEQAVQMHSTSGMTTELLLAEARKLYDFVMGIKS
jgi:hypothetical protein